MIINENGKSFTYEGVNYSIGDTVIANDKSKYKGLVGTITEIRDGDDKETENDTPDIYCAFSEPIFPEDIKELEKTFSDLYGEPKTISDIPLDMVIMAPYMISSANDRSLFAKKIKLYAVTEDWANDDNYGFEVKLFATKDAAMQEFKTLVAIESLNGIIADIKCSTDYIEELDSLSYECYIDGFHCESHYSVSVKEKELILTTSSLSKASKLVRELMYRNDFIEQIEDWDELSKLTPEQYQKMLTDPALAERFQKALDMNDCYLDSYWEVISEVSHEIVREYTKGA